MNRKNDDLLEDAWENANHPLGYIVVNKRGGWLRRRVDV